MYQKQRISLFGIISVFDFIVPFLVFSAIALDNTLRDSLVYYTQVNSYAKTHSIEEPHMWSAPAR